MSYLKYAIENIEPRVSDFGEIVYRPTREGLLIHDHCPYRAKRFDGTRAICFDMNLWSLYEDSLSWVGFCLNMDRPDDLNSSPYYNIIFHHSQVELTKWSDNESKQLLYGTPHPLVPTDPEPLYGILPNHFYHTKTRHSVVAGAIDEEEGVRLFLYIDGNQVFDMVDRDNPIRGGGYFAIQGMTHPFELLPFSGISRPSDSFLELHGPAGKAYPYPDCARDYLLADDPEVYITDYLWHTFIQPITLDWHCSRQDIESYTLELSRDPSYADAISFRVTGNQTSQELYNLYKGTTYYCRLTAHTSDGVVLTDEKSFRTTSLGPRVILAEGVDNFRDLGGYKTASGKIIRQGLAYRCATLDELDGIRDGKGYRHPKADMGQKRLQQELKIRTEIDLRGEEESSCRTESPIPGAQYLRFPIHGYRRALEESREQLLEIFRVFADRKNYPLCFHCYAGADRTGTLAYLLGSLLGMNRTDLVHDYEFTAFSRMGIRSVNENNRHEFGPVEDFIAKYPGESLARKTENYLLSIGVTGEEIAAIRSILTE